MKLLVFRSGCTFLNPTSNACCFTFSPAFAVVGFKNCSHSSGCKVVSYCDFNLCFLIGHNVEYLSCFFFFFSFGQSFVKGIFKFFGHSKNGINFSLLIFMSYLCILYTNTLSDI